MPVPFSSGLILWCISAGILLGLGALAWRAEKGHVPLSWVLQPFFAALALTVPSGVTLVYSVVVLPYETTMMVALGGMGIITLYLLAPSVLNPMLRVIRHHQLDSLAGLMEFRYHSVWVGRLTALILVCVGLMLLATGLLMLHRVLNGHLTLTLSLYALMALAGLVSMSALGRRSAGRGPALVWWVALQSLIKVVVLFGVSGFLIHQGFGGLEGFGSWVNARPLLAQQFMAPLHSGLWQPLMLLSGVVTLLVPHVFQMALVEPPNPRQLRAHRWMVIAVVLPFLLLTPVLYAAMHHLDAVDPAPLLTQLWSQPLLGGGLALVMILGLGSTLVMTMIPLQRMVWRYALPSPVRQFARSPWGSLGLVAVLMGLVAGLFLALLSFAVTPILLVMLGGIVLLLPLMGGVWLWPRLNRHGALGSLVVGLLGWVMLVVLPHLVQGDRQQQILLPWLERFDPLLFPLVILLVCCVVLGMASQLYPQSSREYSHALECVLYESDQGQRHPLWQLITRSPQDVQRLLTRAIGRERATHYLEQARLRQPLPDHPPPTSEQMEQFRQQVLVAMIPDYGLGPALALLDQTLPYQARFVLGSPVVGFESPAPARDFPLLHGASTALDSLRRLHRQVLMDLPIGVCSVDHEQRIMGWNRQMATLTGLGDEVVGWRLSELGRPWGELLQQFLGDPAMHLTRQPVRRGASTLLINLQRATLQDRSTPYQVVVVENVTQHAALEDQVAHQDRLAAIGRLVAGVAHEIGNPVAGIHGVAQNLQLDFDDPEIHASAAQIIAQTERIRDIVSALVGYARTDTQDPASWTAQPLLTLMQEAIRLTQLGKRRLLEVYLQIDEQIEIRCYAPQMRQVLINLLANAMDATPAVHKEVRLNISAQETGSHVLLEIEDFGQGLPDDERRDRLFEPFITTKAQGLGTGLGLSVVQGIIRSHGGKIQLIDKRDYDQGHGVIVQLTLPMADPSSLHG